MTDTTQQLHRGVNLAAVVALGLGTAVGVAIFSVIAPATANILAAMTYGSITLSWRPEPRPDVLPTTNLHQQGDQLVQPIRFLLQCPIEIHGS